MRFKTGQKVVCVNRNGWTSRLSGKSKPGPLFNEIVTVESNQPDNTIRLTEYRMPGFIALRFSYEEDQFEPLMDITELTEILEQQPEHA